MKLTTITKILDLEPIPNADKIEKAQVLGWTVVVRKGLHKVGDTIIFVYPDTLLPKKFLDESYEGDEKVRLKTIKMKKTFSAGLVLPISILAPVPPEAWQEGQDVSEILGIEKYVKQIPVSMAGDALGAFPSFFISKTDEDNLRSNPEAVEELEGYDGEIVASVKYDGTSFTAILSENEFHVCSRNLELKDTESSIYWQMARVYRIQEKLQLAGGHWAIQSEIYGSGINGNNLGESDHKIAVFHVKNMQTGELLSPDQIKAWCGDNLLPSVDILGNIPVKDFIRDFKSGALQDLVNSIKYPNGKPAEGLVFKTDKLFPSLVLGKSYWSGKIINELYKD